MPQRTFDAGTPQVAVRTVLAEAFQLDARAVASVATVAGMMEKCSGAARVYTCECPAEGRVRSVRVKPREEWV